MTDEGISYEQALACIHAEERSEICKIISAAHALTRLQHGNRAHLCAIVNAKSGLCPEDCGFCAQSLKYSAQIKRYPLLDSEMIVAKAKEAKKHAAHEFCIVTSGRSLAPAEFKQLLEIIAAVRKSVPIQIDVSVGFLDEAQARKLKEAGVTRINHNVQTSSSFYPSIATTHAYADRIKTLQAIQKAGLEICCGIILGMGESREDRIRAAFEIKKFDPACVPINLLDPRPGTPLKDQALMEPVEILKTIAVFRLILPKASLKLAGGRRTQLGAFQSRALQGGINGLIIGDYLTTEGNPLEEDRALLTEAGLE